MKTLCALLAAAGLLAGCASLPSPEVSLVNVQFSDATAFETTVRFTLRLANETPDTLVLNGGVHKIYVNGLYVGQGLSNEALSLPRLATGTQTVTVHLSNLRLASRLKPLIESKAFAYRIKSTLYATQPAGTIHAISEGHLDLREFQPTRPPAPSF
ncbi:MAG TPA: LEA type 2 family protein [Verrucomicrobiae bacterium]|nr:LEA type 2 family protein [Verrucomicrobiae bacterium]